MIERGVRDDAGAEREGEEVGYDIGCGQVEGGVFVVRGLVEAVVGVHDPCDVVRLPEAVVRLVVGDGEECEVPDVGVVQCRGQDPKEQDKPC